jgi:hypothetical protein
VSTKALPDHGTYRRANGGYGAYEPCRCDPCRAVARAQRKLDHYRKATGASRLVPAGPARDRIRTMRRDMSWAAIAAATGCDPSTLTSIAFGHRRTVVRTTHNKIMAAKVTPSTEPDSWTNATGTVRRVRALAVMGYSCRAIADAIHTDPMHVHAIAMGHCDHVRYRTAQSIARAYRRLVLRPLPTDRYTSRTRNAAQLRGWHGPAAWDDIDNPAALPDDDSPTEGVKELTELRPCGTLAAYRRHLRNKEVIDPACREANRLAQQEKAALKKKAAA